MNERIVKLLQEFIAFCDDKTSRRGRSIDIMSENDAYAHCSDKIQEILDELTDDGREAGCNDYLRMAILTRR